MKSKSVYIHIPFCESKCSYCRFASFGGIKKLDVQLYVNFLCKEIENYSLNQDHRDTIIDTLYFGGGTPGTLDKKQGEQIFITLKNKFIFSENIEISFETTPSTISEQNIGDWLGFGITRFSFGVQTLNKRATQEIDRSNKGDILEKLDILKNKYTPFSSAQAPLLGEERGVSVSLDFIIGLPYVAVGEIIKNLKYICENYSFVDHISVYMLEEYYEKAEQLTEQKNKFDALTYPADWDKLGLKEEEYLQEYSDVKQYLLSQGFHRYEVSNYAKPSKQCRHNQAYWNRGDMYAFGLSASGIYNDIRYTNSSEFKKYYAGEDIFSEKLAYEDKRIEDIMFALRTDGLTEEIIKSCNKEKIDYFIDQNLLILENKKIILTDMGVLLLDYILAEII